ncbi:suppressor of fused domain protein [Metasolibacillus meyeri]|uniref:Suppressor of fused domain protein n=1 Tax=Metasolibacillus meyeri TaxID=1071052 RepID=A0AAW9NQ90_9BACL|nr:suppressor of fused domain protein [Metasolibacillus meyeri]MEC1176988.1 suppressor of fused domain protein [Metasolibacillus meyeri]
MEEENYEASGWDAIDQAVEKIYGDQQPAHYGTMIPYTLGGNDPLDGISVYKSEQPIAHWHFVTYGFSELYEKESDNIAVSGYGFELTFRLVRDAAEEEPPAWALNLLQNMGRYVFASGNVFRSGDYLDANGPICLDVDTNLTALAFIEDSQLGTIDTPNGQVQFLQMIGITADELEAIQTWNTRGLLEACKSYMPYYITDLERASLVIRQEVQDAIANGIEQDGSSTGYLYNDQLAWYASETKPAIITIGAKQATIIKKILNGRLLKNKSLILVGQQAQITLNIGDTPAIQENEEGIDITLHHAALEELSTLLEPKEKIVNLSTFKSLEIHIKPTLIKDQDGNIIETIG